MTDATVLGAVLVGLTGIVGLVIRLQREQRRQVSAEMAALRKALAPKPAPTSPPPEQIEVRILTRLDALDATMLSALQSLERETLARERLAEQVAELTVASARTSTDLKWIRRALAQESEAPDS